MKAKRIFYDKAVLDDGAILEMILWQLPQPIIGSRHSFKYRLFYGFHGVRIVGYDNERGKGDHRHLLGQQFAYDFSSPEQLIQDFLADVERHRGQK